MFGPSSREFIEFKNTGDSNINLSGLKITNGVDYTFPSGGVLTPGGYYVVVRDPEEFVKFYTKYYGGTTAAHYDGVFASNSSLKSGGERIRVVDSNGLSLPLADIYYL